MNTYKIGIIGSGNIGGTFGKHFAQVGHAVMFSSRHPEQLTDLAEETGAQIGTIEEAAQFGEILLFAPPFKAYPELAQKLGKLPDKIIIEAANPYPQRDGEFVQEILDDPNQTASGYVAKLFPAAKVVKAFNATYFKVFEEQAFLEGDKRLVVPVAGDHEDAKQTVMELIEQIGMAPIDYGKLETGVQFEPGTPIYNANVSLTEYRQRFAS